MKNAKILKGRKVSEITNDLVNDNTNLLDANIEATAKLTESEKLAELLNRTKKVIAENTIAKHSVYKKEILQLFSKRESSARDKIRNIEYSLSLAVTSANLTKSKNFEQSKKDLIDFYTLILINPKVYKSERKDKIKEAVLIEAYNICYDVK